MGRVAVVTGGGSGIGRAVCEHLARAGALVAVADRNGAAAADVAATLDGAIGVEVEVADRASVDAAFETVRTQLGPIAILVTAAAIADFVPFGDITVEQWDRMIAVNLSGTFHCVQLALPDMVATSWGRIVTISSAAGQTASRGQAHYSASKGGVIAMTKTVAVEYAAAGITVNTVPPFAVDTPMLQAAVDNRQLPRTDTVARMIPAGRLGTPDDIAATCAFLCSDAAAYITGQVIAPNGGALT